jgi:prevent-host-death family protein
LSGLFHCPLLLGKLSSELMRTQRVNIDQAKAQLSDLVATAAEGGEVIIVQDNKPLARLVPFSDVTAYKSMPPMPGEFSSDDESLGWDADGWENVA